MDINSLKELWDNIPQISSLASLIFTLGSIIVFMFPIKRWTSNYKKRKALNNKRIDKINDILAPIIGNRDVINDLITTKFYIPIMAQTVEPKIDNEYDIPRLDIVDFFVDQWRDKRAGKKRYLILGGSGTGKTTFFAALVYKYIMGFDYGKEPYAIKLLHLDSCSVSDDIKNINNPGSTILLLDALDENLEANRNTNEFVSKLTQDTKNFMTVVLSSRPQLFANEGEVPKKIHSLGLAGQMEWETFFLSPFSLDDVKIYLENKYSCPSPKYSKALRIVENSSNLMSRAMVLQFIDELLELDPKYLTGFQLYKCIIDKWLTRELQDIVPEDHLQYYMKNYYFFSALLADRMYSNWIHEKTLAICADEFVTLEDKHRGIFPENGYSYRVRSIVERNLNDKIRFAHKSFWEFFIAIYSVENPGRQYLIEESGNAQSFANEIMDLLGTGQLFDVIDYYQVMSENDEVKIQNLLDKAEFMYNDSDDSKKEEVYYKTMCSIYRIIIHRFDYLYSNFEFAYGEFNRLIGFKLILLFGLIYNYILSSPNEFSAIRKHIKEDYFKLPNNVMPNRKNVKIVYKLPIESNEVQRLLTNQVWLADSFSSNESTLSNDINRLLGHVHNNRIDDAFRTFVPTIGVIKEIKKNRISTFVLSIQKNIKAKLNDSKVVILFDLIVEGIHVPLAISHNIFFYNEQQITVFIDRMMCSIESTRS